MYSNLISYYNETSQESNSINLKIDLGIALEVDKKKRVLIADDEPGIGKILSIKFRLSGYDAITTTSGSEAIQLIDTQKPDIVLLDIYMPEVTGIDVLKEVRTFSQVPIVVFTAKPDIIPLAMQSGANDSITKPFNPDRVVKKIETVLNFTNQTC
jgi:DNA-binding response OmpR family regulator